MKLKNKSQSYWFSTVNFESHVKENTTQRSHNFLLFSNFQGVGWCGQWQAFLPLHLLNCTELSLNCFLVSSTTLHPNLGFLESQFPKGFQPCKVRLTRRQSSASCLVLPKNQLKGRWVVNVNKPQIFKNLQGSFLLLAVLLYTCVTTHAHTHRHVKHTAALFRLFSLGWTQEIVAGGKMLGELYCK